MPDKQKNDPALPDQPQSRGPEPWVGELSIVSFPFAPVGWALCDGSLLPINVQQNIPLFSLIGTTFGGNGTTTFALPDLRGRVPLHVHLPSVSGGLPGIGEYQLGQAGGSEAVTLTALELPQHTHRLAARNERGSTHLPANNYPAIVYDQNQSSELNGYDPSQDTLLAEGMITPAGGSLPHSNLQPYLTLNFIIAIQGIFPTRP